MSDLNPESPLGQQLKQNIVTKLGQINLGDDANDISEFIMVLIHNDKSPNEIVSEISNIFGDVINEEFIQGIFSDIIRLRSGNGQEQQEQQQNQQSQPQNQQQNQQQQQFQPQIPQFQPQQLQDQHQKQVGFQSQPIEHLASIPSLPKSFANPRNSSMGIGKNGQNRRNNQNFALKNEQNFKKMLGMAAGLNFNGATKRKAPPRCRQHPYCTNKECQFSHPTKLCFAYPNCPNAAGTCNYLHPGEDDALFAQIANIKQLKQANREEVKLQFYAQNKFRAAPQAPLPESVVCKFGAVCQKESCPFAHPTPANKDAHVTQFEWCPERKSCSNAGCQKSHPSPHYQPSAEEQLQKQQRLLEQCKYGAKCTNYKCPRRHATSPVMCRDGANCTRLDCFFTHPIDEDCRFGVGCMNVNCPYKHPEGRSVGKNKWVANTSERTFAVPEDEIMEHAPAQEAT